MSAASFHATSLTSSSSILLQDRRRSGFTVGRELFPVTGLNIKRSWSKIRASFTDNFSAASPNIGGKTELYIYTCMAIFAGNSLETSPCSDRGRPLISKRFPRVSLAFPSPTCPQTGTATFQASPCNLDALSHYSQVVPDTVVFDDFERFPPTAATVSSALLLGICSLPDTAFKGAVDTALADKECYGLDPNARMTCFVNKALVNVGGELSKLVPGRVSTEVDARLAYDTHAIVGKVENLLQLYNSIDIPAERLLFKIPSTWQGIEAARLLESEGIQTHMTFVYSFAQAAAAAQAGASVIQIFVGRLRDWARTHSGDPEIEAAVKRGEDPGLALVTKAYNYIHKYGHKSKLMVASIRNKQDVFNVLGVDYIITPMKILQALKDSVTPDDDKYTFVKRLSSESAAAYNFTEEELVKWDQRSFASAMGPAALELLASGMDGYSNQAKRVEELFGKIWPPPNV